MIGAATLAMLAALAAAAGRPGRADNPAPPAGGALAGRVRFEGSAPAPRRISVTKDEEACAHAVGEVQDVRVGADQGLANVVVEILGIKPEGAPAWKHPEGGYVIRQKDCRFAPDFLVVPEGADLTIHNDDPVMHNINTGQWNVGQVKGAKPIRRPVEYDGLPLVRVNCNVHSWMEAWLYVARSPLYAVSGADGRFRIENVPPGAYKATAVHPVLGTRKFSVAIEVGKTAEQDLTFTAR
jgi:hypothetical protein